MLDLRDALRAGLAQLDASAGRVRCVYSSASTDLCDAENVLFYNVGMSSFVRLAERHVIFERARVVPTSPAVLSGPALHHHLYTGEGDDEFGHWRAVGELTSWEGRVPRRADKAADWWWETRSALHATFGPERAGQPFALRVRIGGLRRATASLLKPMLDGVIAALHRDASPPPEAVRRLARHLGQGEAQVRERLTSAGAALGPRELVRAYREGLQWNPADDLCVACSVANDGPSASPVVRASLLAVAPAEV
jgi:hypothetical protein